MAYRLLTLAGVTVASVLALVVVYPISSQMVEDWSRRDVELRSSLVFNALRDSLATQIAKKASTEVAELFARVIEDERVVGLAFCDELGRLAYSTPLMPKSVACDKLTRGAGESFSTLSTDGRSLLIGTFPLSVGPSSGHFVIAHDLGYATQRGEKARFYTLATLAPTILLSGALAGTIALLVLRSWLERLRQALYSPREALSSASRFSIDAELQHLLKKLETARDAIDTDNVQWNAETLRRITADELPDLDAIVVANREPYIHNYEDSRIVLQTPASGVVAALEPVMRACGGTWIAHGSGSADKAVVDRHDRIAVPPNDPQYKLRRIWLSDDEQDGYYYGVANEGLWPLCHMAYNRPVFRRADWDQYKAINQRFADAVIEESRSNDPVVLIQDYHFALVPEILKRRLPEATVVTFWHIPWPNAEAFSICPWKEEVLEGLLGSSILGFHTQSHCNNFIESIDRFMESRIDRERNSIVFGGQETLIRPYPISIEWPNANLEGREGVDACRHNVRQSLGVPDDVKLAVGVERFDYTKGILDRIRGVDAFLETHPEWRGKFTLAQIAAPSRSKLPLYASLQREAELLAADVNERHGINGVLPIRLIVRHHEPDEIFQYFRAADACVVSSLHDGMNLVAKEFVASRDDEHGVLLLSHFAGASRELPEAILINPFDPEGFSDALLRALNMPRAEQRERMRFMRAVVRSRNVYRWAGQMLIDAAQLRKRKRIQISNSAAIAPASGIAHWRRRPITAMKTVKTHDRRPHLDNA